MSQTQAFSFDKENLDWIQVQSKSCGLKSSTFLNQVIRRARGEISILDNSNPSLAIKNSQKELIEENKVQEDKRIEIAKIKKERRERFLRACLTMQKYDDPTIYCDIANKSWGITDMMPEEVADYILYETKNKERVGE